jgi:hypothetical protein
MSDNDEQFLKHRSLSDVIEKEMNIKRSFSRKI